MIGLQRKSIALGAHYIKGRVTGLVDETMEDMILEGTAQSNIKRLTSAEVRLLVSVVYFDFFNSFISFIFIFHPFYVQQPDSSLSLSSKIYGQKR